MNVYDDLKRRGIEFEDFPEPTDIRVSKVFQTPDGDKIRLIPTIGRSILVTGVGQREAALDTLIITGDIDSIAKEAGFAGRLWDLAKKAGKSVLDTVAGGGGGGGGGSGQTCTTTTEITLGEGGTIESIKTTTTCK